MQFRHTYYRQIVADTERTYSELGPLVITSEGAIVVSECAIVVSDNWEVIVVDTYVNVLLDIRLLSYSQDLGNGITEVRSTGTILFTDTILFDHTILFAGFYGRSVSLSCVIWGAHHPEHQGYAHLSWKSTTTAAGCCVDGRD